MKSFKFIYLFFLMLAILACELKEPEMKTLKECTLPTSITATPKNWAEYDFQINISPANITAVTWVIKNSANVEISRENKFGTSAQNYTFKIGKSGAYNITAEITANCGNNGKANAAITINPKPYNQFKLQTIEINSLEDISSEYISIVEHSSGNYFVLEKKQSNEHFLVVLNTKGIVIARNKIEFNNISNARLIRVENHEKSNYLTEVMILGNFYNVQNAYYGAFYTYANGTFQSTGSYLQRSKKAGENRYYGLSKESIYYITNEAELLSKIINTKEPKFLEILSNGNLVIIGDDFTSGKSKFMLFDKDLNYISEKIIDYEVISYYKNSNDDFFLFTNDGNYGCTKFDKTGTKIKTFDTGSWPIGIGENHIYTRNINWVYTIFKQTDGTRIASQNDIKLKDHISNLNSNDTICDSNENIISVGRYKVGNIYRPYFMILE